ncbi:MAG TPA: oxaloacetate decarboxylase [Acetobacteraceae bacterium]|nr:oxaloacetate decarboxylase [Acetobacteraceae bacterium]
MKKTSLFKQHLQAPEILMIPVAHDPLCAKIIERAGFKAVGCAGYANSAALIGAPDVELLTLSEMVDTVWRMADTVDLPVWADGDNGHGNTTNVQRTVRQMEKAGAASLMLEDQVSPKRCGHMSGKHVVPIDEFVAKIRAAVDARTDQDFTILARTDAIAVNGISDAVERAHLAIEAGADWVFLEAPETLDQMREIPGLVKVPSLANMIPGGKTPILPAAELQAMGFAALVWPNAFTYAYAKLATDMAAELLQTGTTASYDHRMIEFEAFNELVGLSKIRDSEMRYYQHIEDTHRRGS